MTLHRVLLACVVGLGLFGGGPAGTAPAARAADDTELLAFVRAGLRQRQEAVKHLAAQLAVEHYRRPLGQRVVDGHVDLYAFWVDADYWREDWIEAYPNAQGMTFAGDGSKAWVFDASTRSGGPWRREYPFVSANWSLDLMKARPENCPTALLLAAEWATVTETEVGGQRYYQVDCVDQDGDASVWLVDPQHGYAVARYEWSWQASPGVPAGSHAYIVDAWQKMDGYWLPRHCRSVGWHRGADGQRAWVNVARIRIAADGSRPDQPRFYTEIYPLGAAVTRSEGVMERFGGNVSAAIGRLKSHAEPPAWMLSPEPVESARLDDE